MKDSKTIKTPVATGVKEDRRNELRAAAALVRASLKPEFKQLGADEIMACLRGEDATAAPSSPTTRRERR